ncbi:MAG TPA: hypothetical protein VMF52_10640 [Steroidobacteraceae bacterium]|nr:hypothetical protein [Steroidobacteraceae bacterium]
MTRIRKLKRVLRVPLWVVAALAIVKSAWFAWAAPAADGNDIEADRADIAARRDYLLARVATGSFGVLDMPSFVNSPYRQELAIATLSATSVAMTNVAFRDPAQRERSRDAVRIMLDRLLSDEIRRYDVLWWGEDALDTLDGPNGHVGYLGHLNLTLGCYFLLGGDDPEMGALFERVSATLARRLEASNSLHAESFPGWIYTADNVVVIASLRMHDLAFGDRYADLVSRWLAVTRAKLLDPDSGMMRYHVSKAGEAAGTARGVLQAWDSLWLPLIDEEFARDQYARLNDRLVARSAVGNFVAIREYPAGESGPTDLVSGPLIFGLSPTATGFAMGGAAFRGERGQLAGLLRTAELAGFTVSWGGRRSYLFAPLPGDAIILAARTMTRWDARFVSRALPR